MDLKNKAGHIASFLGIACAIHCLLMPVLIGVIPLVGLTFLTHGWVEFTILLSAFIISVMSLCWGYRVHGKARTFAILLAAILFFVVGHISDHTVICPIVGGICLAGSQFLNRHLCKTCPKCCPHDDCFEIEETIGIQTDIKNNVFLSQPRRFDSDLQGEDKETFESFAGAIKRQ